MHLQVGCGLYSAPHGEGACQRGVPIERRLAGRLGRADDPHPVVRSGHGPAAPSVSERLVADVVDQIQKRVAAVLHEQLRNLVVDLPQDPVALDGGDVVVGG